MHFFATPPPKHEACASSPTSLLIIAKCGDADMVCAITFGVVWGCMTRHGMALVQHAPVALVPTCQAPGHNLLQIHRQATWQKQFSVHLSCLAVASGTATDHHQYLVFSVCCNAAAGMDICEGITGTTTRAADTALSLLYSAPQSGLAVPHTNSSIVTNEQRRRGGGL